jgi:HK97 family phage prohead protease
MNDKETRTFGTAFEFRANDETESLTIRGHAAVFDTLSQDLGGFREKIEPGAFKETLDRDVRALFNHDPNMVLGRSKSGTLRMEEDKVGLAVEIDPPASADTIVEALTRGDVDQMSFGFRTLEDAWEKVDGEDIRTLRKVELFDVSVVTFPAYTETDVSIALRSRADWEALDDLDRRRRRLV